MNKLLKTAIVALGVTGIAYGATAPASAAGFAIDFGNVAVGYSDGWYDHSHHWHRWHGSEARYYRDHYRHSYYEWRHDDRHHRHHGWHH